MQEGHVNLREISASAAGQEGVIWALKESTELNANLVRFGEGGGVAEHINEEVDVIFVGVSGHGAITVDDEEHPLAKGTMTFVPLGARRSVWSASEDFAYLSIHRRRGPLQIGG